MEISRTDAVSLLRKWMTENRVIHCSVAANKALIKILGRIDSIENGTVHFSQKKSNTPLGESTFIQFPLQGATFEYDDAARAPEPLPTKLKGYDAVMAIFLPNVTIGLAILPPLEEWAIPTGR